MCHVSADISVPVFFREKCRTQLVNTIQEEKISELEGAGLSGQNICPHSGIVVSSSDCLIFTLAPSYYFCQVFLLMAARPWCLSTPHCTLDFCSLLFTVHHRHTWGVRMLFTGYCPWTYLRTVSLHFAFSWKWRRRRQLFGQVTLLFWRHSWCCTLLRQIKAI